MVKKVRPSTTRRVAVAVVVLAIALGLNTMAAATPGFGTERTPTVQGKLKGPQKSKADGIELKTKSDVKVDDFELTYHVGGFSGWHEHPGIVIATVKSGAVERKLGCGPAETFTAGQTFTEVGIHYVSNPSSTDDAVLAITQIYPADWVGPARTDLPPPVC